MRGVVANRVIQLVIPFPNKFGPVRDNDLILWRHDLAHLSDLLAMRERVRGVHDWPMDMTTYRRVGLYVIIPPLAWIGAAVVEMVLASALD